MISFERIPKNLSELEIETRALPGQRSKWNKDLDISPVDLKKPMY